MSSAPVTNWPRAMAKRLGIGGDVEFTRAAVGQTLHLYCGAGDHIVDVHIAARQHPDAVAKKLLASGWVMGSKLKCPKHSRRKAADSKANKTRLLSDTAPRSAVLSHAADKILAGEYLIKTKAPDPGDELVETNRWQRRVIGKIKRLPKDKPTPPKKPDIIKAAKAAEQEGKTMPEASQKPAVPSDAAKKAKRMVFLLLEEQYDENKKCYRPGWDDKKIATESGAHVKVVEDTRVEFFGPLGEPAELTALRNEFAAHRQDAEAKIKAINDSISSMQSRFTRLCVKNGWGDV